MKLASHNTFTYLPVSKWWMKPFAFMARCQRIGIMNQYDAGARMFDIRLRFDMLSKPVLCHGLIEYEHKNIFIESILSLLNYKGDCCVRMVLETTKHDAYQEACFHWFCWYCSDVYKNIKFVGGNNRTDWLCEHPIYHFRDELPSIENAYASATTRFPNGKRWLGFIDDLYPYDYAKRYNRKSIEKGTDKEWLMLDFVDIK